MTASFSIPEKYDLTFSPVSDSWHGGLFSGNGEIGVMVYADYRRQLLRLRLGDVRYIDRRPENMRLGKVSYDSPRLEAGSFYWKAPGISEDSFLRLDLRKAEIRGSIGGKAFSVFTARDPSVIAVETELEFAFFEPAEPISPRYFIKDDMPENFRKNPPPVLADNSCTQHLFNGKSFTVGWKREGNACFIACGYGNEAEKILAGCSSARIPQWKDQVARSYQEFYETSSLSVPDQELERLYCINLYKWHSATRKENDFALDLLGPWTKKTAWCAIWWNLNIQLTYQWLQTANRIQEMRPLIKMIADHLPQFGKNAKFPGGMAVGRASSYDCRSPVKKEKGNLPWVCHILAETYFHTGSEELLALVKKILCGVLKEYENLLFTDPSGVIHMEKTLPPEYGETVDSTFDLALLRKCLGYFLDFYQNDASKEEEKKKYRFILDHLADYPKDETGYRMGKDLALDHSHPHTSHLFMVYPLELPHDKNAALKSIDRFLAMEEEHHGYSYTNTAAMFARYGNGSRARDLLHRLLDWMQARNMPNTMYHEGGSPVIETPFAFNGVLQDMLLLNSRGLIRLFPAVPDDWNEVSFRNFHCFGNIRIDASFNRKEHSVRCRLLAQEDRQVKLELPDRSLLDLTLEKDRETVLDLHLK